VLLPLVALEPGVGEDEDGGAGEEGDARAPCAALLEGILEELERDRRDQRARRERQEPGRDLPRRRSPRADRTTQRQRA